MLTILALAKLETDTPMDYADPSLYDDSWLRMAEEHNAIGMLCAELLYKKANNSPRKMVWPQHSCLRNVYGKHQTSWLI